VPCDCVSGATPSGGPKLILLTVITGSILVLGDIFTSSSTSSAVRLDNGLCNWLAILSGVLLSF